MKIKQVTVKKFKRFADLTVTGIPETAKLVLLAGPNGSGKSSFFDALYCWHRINWAGRGFNWDPTYHSREASSHAGDTIDVQFHGIPVENHEALRRKKAIYARTAYRNEPDFRTTQVGANRSMLDEGRFDTFSQNDASVSANYSRIASQAMEDLFENKPEETTFGAYRYEAVGVIRDAMLRIFPELTLLGVGTRRAMEHFGLPDVSSG